MRSSGVYISAPFCRSKCSYCNFASGVYPAAYHAKYVARLRAEIRCIGDRLQGWSAEIPRRIDSLYLGGGTPSLLTPELLRELAAALRQEFDFAPEAEITLESAPGQLDGAALDAMLALGVNRISFGVQSFVDREAAATGRLHTRKIVFRDLQSVRAAGIRNISVDLIAGLPHQDERSWQESLEALAEAQVSHASVYMLERDEDSRLGRELLSGGSRYRAHAVPDDGLTADLYEMAIAHLEGHELFQYEISNFARQGNRSRHNERYWLRQPYLGFGLDAHSMVRTHSGGTLRFANSAVLEDYLESPSSSTIQLLSRGEEMEEAWFLGLRLCEGVSWAAFAEEFGQEALQDYHLAVDELRGLELLTEQAGVVRLTRRGVLFSNEVFSRLLLSGDGGAADQAESADQAKSKTTV